MIKRAIEERIHNALTKKKAVTIMGPRQVGKSTLADAIIPKDAKVLEINGDNTDVQTMFVNVDEAKMKLLIGNKNFLFVDEAQKIENVGNMLKIVAEKFKDVKIIYDKALLTSERDIADEGLWHIVTDRERRKQSEEMERFGNKQVDRFLEERKKATESKFTSSLEESEESEQ